MGEVDNAFGEFSIEDGMIDAVQLKGLMVSKKKKEKKPNKRVSPNLSYQRHHLIRISSCHKTTSKKKTKKNEFSSKNSSHQSPVAACIQFFWKVVLLPSRIRSSRKNNSGHKLSTTHTEERSIRNEK